VTPEIFLRTFVFFFLLLRKQTGIQNKSYGSLQETVFVEKIFKATAHCVV